MQFRFAATTITVNLPDRPALLAAVRPAGLVLQGGHELKPGLRDFAELEALFEALEEA